MTGTPVEGGSVGVDRLHQGRVALITGGSRGQSVAVELARRGAHVVIGARTDQSETGQLVADTGGEASALTLDISDTASVEEARTRVEADLGQVDILVNNAATFETATWDALDFELWQRVMSVNLNGTMLVCKAFLPLMRGAWLGPRDQHRVGISRDREPRVNRLPRKQDGNHRADASLIGDARP